MKIFNYVSLVLLMISCSTQTKHHDAQSPSLDERIRNATQMLAEAESSDKLTTFMECYNDDAISMPEYQVTLHGRTEIERYYKQIFNSQDIKSLKSQPHEFISVGSSTIVEIGTFKKEYSKRGLDSIITLNGKYWHVWQVNKEGDVKLKAESFGYFHPVTEPDEHIIGTQQEQPDEADIVSRKDIPFELKAYNALMEKGVRNRDGVLRASFFTDDASFFPFADTTVTGIDRIKPYLHEYSSRGRVVIDTITCYTYDFEQTRDYILEYDMFKVKWSVPDVSGRTEGKGIRIWKRQKDHSLKLYREIGTHNHLKL